MKSIVARVSVVSIFFMYCQPAVGARLQLELRSQNTEAADSALILIDCLFREGDVETDVFTGTKARFPLLLLEGNKGGLLASLQWAQNGTKETLGTFREGDALHELCQLTLERLRKGLPKIDLALAAPKEAHASTTAPALDKKTFLARNWIYFGLGAVVAGGAALLLHSKKVGSEISRPEARGFVVR